MKFTRYAKKPAGFVLAAMLCSSAGFLFGVDTGIIGPVTVMPKFIEFANNPSPVVHGLIVSTILIPAAIASFFAGRLADVIGRPRGIALGCLIFGIGTVLEAAAIKLAMFIVGRVVEGIGEGLYLGTLVVYICEISPPKHRGTLTTGPQLVITFGLVVGYFTCYGTTKINSTFQWRIPFILLALYAFTCSALVYAYLPHSPRWLKLKGLREEAAAAWEKLDVAAADREKIEDQLELADANASTAGTSASTGVVAERRKSPLLDVFSKDARPRLFLAVFLMGMQQLSGIDGVLYYAPILFKAAGLASNEASFLASGVSAILIFTVSLPATLFADKWGRRANTILGGLGMTTLMFLIGSLYAGHAVHANTGAGRWVVILSIYFFALLYSISWAVGIKIYAAEIQPQRTRASATSIAHGSNWLSNFLVALITPQLLSSTASGAYFLFGSCTLATAIVCWFAMPETRGRTLDEIEEAFQTGHFAGFKGFMSNLGRRLLRARPQAVAS